MSTTQGEQKQSIRATIIGGVIAIVVAVGAVGGVAVASDNARQQAAQLHLLAVAKSSSIVMEAATTEDAAVTADAVQAQAITHTDQLAADAQAAYDAKIAAQKAAAAKAAADAQQPAAQQSTQQATTDPVQPPAGDTGANGLPSGAPVPKVPDGSQQGFRWDTNACASHNASIGADGNAYCD